MTDLRAGWLHGDLLLGLPSFGGDRMFLRVSPRVQVTHITMLLTEAVAPGPFCLEIWPLVKLGAVFI